VSPDITNLLQAWRGGDPTALEQLMPLVYDELRRLARGQLRRERSGHSLQPTALVNEAFLRLVEIHGVDWRDRSHFLAMSARVMRRVLVDSARARLYLKRGGGATCVTFDETAFVVGDRGHSLVDLDDALEALGDIAPRKARVVDLRFFAGLTLEEVAAELQVSSDTVVRDWQFARVWLLRELSARTRAS
jgi:RNA polymerase sigma factor (TIGR02999 family)